MSQPVLNILPTERQPQSAAANVTSIDQYLESEILDEKAFIKTLCLERKRTDRSNIRFVLMLSDFASLNTARRKQHFGEVLCALLRAIRETDIKGWYKNGSVLGVIFTGIAEADRDTIACALSARVIKALSGVLAAEQINELKLSFHLYPEQSGKHGPDSPLDLSLYPDMHPGADGKTIARAVKRGIDILGSLLALILLSPLFAAISLAIKLTSKGPILFRQERVGQYGRKFTFFKFRSMYFENDSTIHEEYVKQLIAGSTAGNGKHCAFKLTDDPRVTPIGRFLRKTSLDEFPQFMNVLRGEMSLVGPRPPIPYEFDCYRTWHKRRVLAVKPGITGPWQVGGRSRVKFDDMVRLDLQYAKSWSVWQDLKILWKTPKAVVSGNGAW
jgi:lipopolysaccharide/colanic/teichoic acid biosynthesis glycosyltransferase